MSVTTCSYCGGRDLTHWPGCPHGEPLKGERGNPLPLLVLPFVVMAIPFFVAVFPLASIITIGVAMALNWGSHGNLSTGAYVLTIVISLLVFLGALNAEHWAERFRGYRIGRHVLRVVGVPWLAAQYIMYGSGVMAGGRPHLRMPTPAFIGDVVTRPGVLITVIVLAVLAHLVGESFDLSGRRPGSWGEFFRPRESVFTQSPQRATRAPSFATPGTTTPEWSPANGPRSLSRKLMIALGAAFALGVLGTIVGRDYDSAVLVILRIGILAAVPLCGIVAIHHVLTRRSRARV